MWVQGVEVLILLGAFISAKCGSSISARLLIYGAYAVCFCTLFAILDTLYNSFFLKIHGISSKKGKSPGTRKKSDKSIVSS
jgi:hypothetical protein